MSRLRTKVCALLIDALAQRYPGCTIRLTPEDIVPTVGWYRTSAQSDCYRWEAFARVKFGEANVGITIGSFVTLTDLARCKALDLVEMKTWWMEAFPAADPDNPTTERAPHGIYQGL